MKCERCEKEFNEAGHIINYRIFCPYCKCIQKGKKKKKKVDLLRIINYVEENGITIAKGILLLIGTIVLIWGVYLILGSLPSF